MLALYPGQRADGNVLRRGIGIEQDVSVLEILRGRPLLQVLLEGIAVLDGRDGGHVNVRFGGIGVIGGHVDDDGGLDGIDEQAVKNGLVAIKPTEGGV